jgi:hypothetical protein
VNVHPITVVLNETHLPEPIHEETDSRPGGTDHFCESLLTHFRNERYGFRFLTKVGHQQKEPGKAFLTGVEEVIDKVCFHADIPGKKIGKKLFSKLRFLMKQCNHGPLFDADYGALLVGAGGGHPNWLTRETALAEETGPSVVT